MERGRGGGRGGEEGGEKESKREVPWREVGGG